MSEIEPTTMDAFERFATNPAVVTIDLHRGHLDPEVATLPLNAENAVSLLHRTLPLLETFRRLGLPVIHMVTSYRNREEILRNPYWAVQSGRPDSVRRGIAEHNLEGGPGVELMPGVEMSGDVVLDTKKRYDCFIDTDLEQILRTGGHDSILLFGVNTNSCVLATAIAASVRDWAVFVVEDGVDSMMGGTYHRAALDIIGGSFGWVIDGETSVKLLSDRADPDDPERASR